MPTCVATSADEQAVSTVSAGPRRLKAYATRPDTTLPAMPRVAQVWVEVDTPFDL